VKCLCLTKVSKRLKSKIKIKHCMTVKVKNYPSFSMLHIGYSSPSVIALDYDFTFFYKKNSFHPVTYGGRHDCFRFRKHPSSFTWNCLLPSCLLLAFSQLLVLSCFLLFATYYSADLYNTCVQAVIDKGSNLIHGDRCFKSMISWRTVTMEA